MAKVKLLIKNRSGNDIKNYSFSDEEIKRKAENLDLTNHGLSVIHDDYLLKYQNVQYLYLEGNMLKEISKAFFPTLKQLKWLDIRNNKLTTVPASIVDHLFLQVLLLDGNNIERLPIEIGSLSSLRGLQLSRNPIVYPPLNIVNQGVQSTIDFLRKQWQQHHSPQQIQLISETHSHSFSLKSKSSVKESKQQRMGACKSAVVLKVNSHKSHKPRKVQSGICSSSLNKCISVHTISQQNQQPTVDIPVSNWMYQSTNYEKKQSCIDLKTERNVEEMIDRNALEKVKSHLLRDLWLDKIRQVLITQDTILQRKRDAEALKQWQNETKEIQQKFPKKGSDVEMCFPYDTHPEYLKMMSRQELSLDRDKIPGDSTQQSTKQGESVNCSIISIMTALREVQRSQSITKVSPRSEQKVLAYEIKKIKDIQRSLNALKLRNFGQLNIN